MSERRRGRERILLREWDDWISEWEILCENEKWEWEWVCMCMCVQEREREREREREGERERERNAERQNKLVCERMREWVKEWGDERVRE